VKFYFIDLQVIKLKSEIYGLTRWFCEFESRLPVTLKITNNNNPLKLKKMELNAAVKNFLHAGVDLMSSATEKFETSVNELVGKGKINPEEGKKMVDDFLAKAKVKKEEAEAKFNEFTAKFKSKTKEEELADLKKKVADLETELGGTKKTAKTEAAK
jgi:polyhydroxyalkanoate synthesis regulator phasin